MIELSIYYITISYRWIRFGWKERFEAGW